LTPAATSFPTRRSSDLRARGCAANHVDCRADTPSECHSTPRPGSLPVPDETAVTGTSTERHGSRWRWWLRTHPALRGTGDGRPRSAEHTSELQSLTILV